MILGEVKIKQIDSVPETTSAGKGTHEDAIAGQFSYALYTDDAWYDW